MPRRLALCLLAACNSGPADEITLSQTASTAVSGGNWCSATANPDGPTVENSYYRVFDLRELGVRGGFRISTLTVGVDEVVQPAGTAFAPAELLIHEYTGPVGGTTLDMSAMRLLATNPLGFTNSAKGVDRRATFLLADPTDVVIDLDASVDVIAVELHSPRIATNDRTFRIGVNTLGATGPSYHRCPGAANLEVPTSLAALGFPTSHIVLQLTGFEIPDPGSDSHPRL